MRTSIWVSMITAALISSAGCRKTDESAKQMDKASTTAAKAQENVNEQVKDVTNQQKDVAKDQDKLAKDQADVAKQRGELTAAQTDLTQARDSYRTAAKQRVASLDAKLHQIEMKTDAQAKDTAAKLRVRRDQISTRLGAIDSQSAGDWDSFRKDVDGSFDKLEGDVNDALK